MQNMQNMLYIWVPLTKRSNKKSCLKQSLGSEDIIDLKINYFRDFFPDDS